MKFISVLIARQSRGNLLISPFPFLLLAYVTGIQPLMGSAPSTNLAAVFASMNFDPHADNCAMIVQISDIHMSVTDAKPVVTTNLDSRLVSMVNELTPAPARIVCTGDLSLVGSVCAGRRRTPTPARWNCWLRGKN